MLNTKEGIRKKKNDWIIKINVAIVFFFIKRPFSNVNLVSKNGVIHFEEKTRLSY